MSLAESSSIAPVSTPRLPGSRHDHRFFGAMAILLLLSVFIGFAHTYYLAGLFHAPLPSFIIHVHGAVYSIWILLFVTQTGLVSARRVDMHRRLGVIAFLWACLMIVLGLLAAVDGLRRGAGPPGRDPGAFFAVPVGDMVIFSTLILFSFRNRAKPAVHKRLIVIATVGVSVAAINRWPFLVHHHNGAPYSYMFLALLVAYDLWSTHHVYAATLCGSAYLITIQQLCGPIGKTALWLSFADHIRSCVT